MKEVLLSYANAPISSPSMIPALKKSRPLESIGHIIEKTIRYNHVTMREETCTTATTPIYVSY